MNTALWITISLALTCGFAAAQNRKNAPSQIEFRVTRFDPTDQTSPVFKVGQGGDSAQIEIPLTYIGGPHKATLRDGRFLDLRRDSAKLPEISLPIAENEHTDLLLIFIPAAQSFNVIKVLTPLARMRGGDRLIINATNKRLVIKSGEEKPVFIDPTKSGIFNSSSDKIVSIPVIIGLEEGGQWKMASTENWQFDPRFRRYLFAYISPRNRQLTFHAVTERMEKEP
jgi:hypothetical protein